MRRLAFALSMFIALLPQHAVAQDAGVEIRGVISDQIAAFKADDFEMAFTFASPGIKRLFGSPGRFGQMVRSGFPMVWRPAGVRFTDLSVRDGRQVQSVIVTDQAGTLHVLDYEMVPGQEGWLINGVWVREADGAGA